MEVSHIGGDALTSTFRVIEPEPNYEPDYEAETEIDYGTITEFNAEVDRKITGKQNDEEYKGFSIKEISEESFFSEIVGYADIKKLLLRCIRSSYDNEERMHVILDGPPASAKNRMLIEQ